MYVCVCAYVSVCLCVCVCVCVVFGLTAPAQMVDSPCPPVRDCSSRQSGLLLRNMRRFTKSHPIKPNMKQFDLSRIKWDKKWKGLQTGGFTDTNFTSLDSKGPVRLGNYQLHLCSGLLSPLRIAQSRKVNKWTKIPISRSKETLCLGLLALEGRSWVKYAWSLLDN